LNIAGADIAGAVVVNISISITHVDGQLYRWSYIGVVVTTSSRPHVLEG
jgi:hypothetical protein